jgi:hypothetical protein
MKLHPVAAEQFRTQRRFVAGVLFRDPLSQRPAPIRRKFARMGWPLAFKFDFSFYRRVGMVGSAGRVFHGGIHGYGKASAGFSAA